MKTSAPLCARGRVRALRGLPRALCKRGLRGPFQPLGCLAARPGEAAAAGRAGLRAGSGRAGGARDGGPARSRSPLALRWSGAGGLRRPVS